MKGIPLKAYPRSEVGSRASRRLRRQGFVPAILYGPGEEPVPLKIPKNELSHVVHARAGEHAMVELHIERNGGEDVVLTVIKEVQHDPVTDLIIHADFVHIHPGRPIAFKLPVEFVGTPLGVKKGGVFTAHLDELEVMCTPQDAPEVIEIDVSNIDLGESLHVKDVSVPNVKILNDPDEVVATVVRPRGVVEAKEEAAPEETAPEEEGSQE